MKKKLGWLLAVWMTAALLLVGCGGVAPQEDSSAANTKDGNMLLLWEVTSPENSDQRLYLMGTIHYGEAAMYPMAASIEEAFAASDALAVELDLLAFEEDVEYARELSEQFAYYRDGSTAADHLSADAHEAAIRVLQENNLYQAQLEQYKVAQWNALLANAAVAKTGLQASYGVDRYLLQQAREADKPIYELESAAFQWGIEDGFSDAVQELLLEESLDIDGQAEAIQQAFEAWKAGDSEAVSKVDLSDAAPEQKALLEEYYKAMLFDRNDAMTAKAETFLKSGETVFLAVGAGHMGGENGIVTQLRGKGCTVRQIAADEALSLPRAA